MNKTMILLILLSAMAVFADDYPQFYERHQKNEYALIILSDPTHATYLDRLTRTDGSKWFFFDDQATWGYFADPVAKKQKASKAIWIKTCKFRFDYLVEGSNLVEFDKMGRQGTYVRIQNEGTGAPTKPPEPTAHPR